MKKTLITCAMILVAVSVYSQETNLSNEKKTRFGITGGFNQDFFATSAYDLDEFTLYGGLFAERKLSERFCIAIGIVAYKNTKFWPL